MSPIRVLHLSTDKLYGGIESVLLTFARERDLCPEMTPSFGLSFTGRLSAELTDAGIPPHPLGDVRVSRFWTVLSARREFQRVAAQVRPDVVVCHESWTHLVFAPAIRKRRLPLVYWAHDFHARLSRLDRIARFSPPDLVIANSRATQATMGTLFPRVRAEVVHNPVAARPPLDAETNRRTIRSELGTPLDAVVFVSACRLEEWKGQRLLLRALARLREMPLETPWVAWIAGGAQRPSEQTYLDELQDEARRAGIADRVRFLGQRRDVPNLLAAADIHCQPNTGPEPFGIAFIEALLAGLPVVTTAIGAAPEIVQDESGILVPPGDPGALAEALRGLVVDPARRRALAAGGPPRARLLCDPARQLAKLAAELRAVSAVGA